MKLTKPKLLVTITIFCIALLPLLLHAAKPNAPDSAIAMTCLTDGTTDVTTQTCLSPQRVEFTGSGYNRIIDVWVNGVSQGLYTTQGGNFDFILDFSSIGDIGIHNITINDVSKGGNLETLGNSATLTINL